MIKRNPQQQLTPPFSACVCVVSRHVLNIDDEHTQSRMPTFIGLHDMPAGVTLQQAYQRDVGSLRLQCTSLLEICGISRSFVRPAIFSASLF